MVVWSLRLGVVLLILGLVLASLGCGGGGGEGKRPMLNLVSDSSGRAITDTNNNGIPDLPSEAVPTVFASFSGFPANQLVEFQILLNGQLLTDPTTGEPILLQLTTDQNGNIPPVPLWDLGINPADGQPISGTATYELRTIDGSVSFRIELLPSRIWLASARNRQGQQQGFAVVLAGEPPRYPMGSVAVGEPVWVEGFGFPPNQQVKVFIVRDKEGWQTGDALTGVVAPTVIQTDSNGNLPQTQIWNSAQRLGSGQTDGDFDVIVDVNGNDSFDASVDIALNSLGTGFTVQETNRSRQNQHLAVQLAASQQGSFKDVFAVGENVSVWVNPPWRPLTPYMRVKKYVVLHKDNWQNGDLLVDVTGRSEWDLIRYACANQYRYPVWIAPLVPGRYDVIIDLDGDGKYTLGVDLIDAGSAVGGEGTEGFRVEGEFPEIRLVLSAVPSAINQNETSTILAQVQTQDGQFVSGATVNFQIVSGSGGQLSGNSGVTNQQGIASVELTANQPGTTIVVRGTVTVANRSAQSEVSVRVRAPGSLGLTIR